MSVSIVRCVLQRLLPVFFVCVGRSPEGDSLLGDERWYRIEFEGQPAGHELLLSEEISDPVLGRLRRCERETVLRLKRLGTDLSVRARLSTVEMQDGRLVRWNLRRAAADGVLLQRSGVWQDSIGAFEVRDGTGGAAVKSLVECPQQPRSPLIAGWLRTEFPEDARIWTTSVFFPESSESAELQFELTSKVQRTGDSETGTSAELMYEFRPLEFPEVERSTLIFRNGEFEGSDQRVLGARLSIRRSEPAKALGCESTEALDLQLRTMIPVTGSVEWGVDRTIQLSLRIPPELRGVLQSAEFQRVQEGVDGETRVMLLDPAGKAAAARVRMKPGDILEYLGSSRWIDCANAEVARAAVLAAGNTSDPQVKCERLEEYVRSRMQFSALSTLQQPASAVLKSWRGDCTEHAVLLAALLRAEKIASRVVVGFVFVPRASAFAPHMWVEAFVEGSWRPLDSTLSPESSAVPRIRVSHSSLAVDSTGCVRVFADLLDFPGRTEISVARDSAAE